MIAALALQTVACGPPKPAKPAAPPVVQVEPAPAVRVKVNPTFTGTPQVAIEMGMHTAVINDAHADAAGRLLVTASDDKTVRVWALSDGKLLRTLRLPAEGVDGGKAYTATITPDGKYIAAGGYTASIFIFHRKSGKLVQRIDELPNSIKSLRYSPDGRLLVAGFASGGIAAYKLPQYKLWRSDADYYESVYGLTFNSRGLLATASEDDYVRVYNTEYALAARRKLTEDLFRIAFSPDDQQLAVGSYDSPKIHLLNAFDLSTIQVHDLSQHDSGNLADVGWSKERLLAGGEFDIGGETPVVVLDDKQNKPMFWPAGSDSLGAMVPLPAGKLAVVMTDPRIVLFDSQGKTLWSHAPDKLDMRNVPLELSADGMSVRLRSFPNDPSPPDRVFVHADASNSKRRVRYAEPRTEAAGLSIKGWKDTYSPSVDSRSLSLAQYEVSRSLAISGDGQRFVLGTEWNVIMYDRSGSQLWKHPTPSVAWAVNISSDGRLVVAAIDDGSLLWYRASDGELLLSHFRSRDGRWVTWTPEGFFNASPGGDQLVGFHFNRGHSGTPAFVSAAQLRASFFHPELMAVSLSDDRSAIRRAVARYGDVGSLVAPENKVP